MFKIWKVGLQVIIVASLVIQGYQFNVAQGTYGFNWVLNLQEWCWYTLMIWVILGIVTLFTNKKGK